jgi:hypothetical protein
MSCLAFTQQLNENGAAPATVAAAWPIQARPISDQPHDG